jgi:hypothetical protein
MIVGSIWYGPIFGQAWMKINNVSPNDTTKRNEMQKGARPLYVVAFFLALFQAWVLARYIGTVTSISGLCNTLWIWAAFLLPTVAAGSMWTADTTKVKWTRFWIQTGYYLVLFVIFGIILGMWK